MKPNPKAKPEDACKHDGMRFAQTYPPDPKTMTQRRMVWCQDCGEVLEDKSWKVPIPE